jgi:propionyl-CoA carboxylase alpha chain
LPFGQEAVTRTGWAIEARVYAEDPQRNFLPSIGRLVRYRPPAGDGIRIDAGVFEGAEISLYYDPMIAKLCAYGADRATATERLGRALDAFYIAGLRHNIGFLAAIAASERFVRGALSTDFIAQEFPDGFMPPVEFTAADRILLIAASLAERRLAAEHNAGAAALTILLDGTAFELSLRPEGGEWAVESEAGTELAGTDWLPSDKLLHLNIEGRVATVQIERLPGHAFRLTHRGVTRRAQVLDRRTAALLLQMPPKLLPDTSRRVVSPMPGLLTAVVVSEGQEVKAGEPLAIVEAMKMENVLRAERDGQVARLCAKPGDSLAVDQIILEFA